MPFNHPIKGRKLEEEEMKVKLQGVWRSRESVPNYSFHSRY